MYIHQSIHTSLFPNNSILMHASDRKPFLLVVCFISFFETQNYTLWRWTVIFLKNTSYQIKTSKKWMNTPFYLGTITSLTFHLILKIFIFIIFRLTMKYIYQEINFLPSSLVALLLKGIAISSVFLARASLYWAADQSFNLSSISGVQHVGPVGQICNETPEIDKLRWL